MSDLSVNYLNGTNYAGQQKGTRTIDSDIGKDAFLKILVAQLQHQDPLKPMEDTDFIAQMAQFSALEQMTNLNHNSKVSQAFGLVGKYVIAQITDSQTGKPCLITGKVDSVISSDGLINVNVGGVIVSLNNIKEVLAEELAAEENTQQ